MNDYTVAELARTVANALSRMEALAARLEGGQFVTSEVFRLYRETAELRFQTIQSELNNVVSRGEYNALKDEVESLKDDKKWLTRLILGFIVLALLGLIFVAGGVPN